MISRRKLLRATALGAISSTALKAFGGRAFAQTYPARPMRWVVPYPPGGATDIVARIVGQHLTERLGQQVVIENRPGAGNNLGTEAVVNAAPDGLTFLLVNPANAINATLYKKLSFNYLRDTIQVAGIIRVPNVMEVHPSVPAKTVAEFIAYAKANPGKVNWATSGNGTSVHLSGELFKMMTGVNLLHVPYRGSAPALTDMLAGQVHVMFDNMPPSLPHIKAGKLRALGVTTAQRSQALPDVPAVGETVAGLRGERVLRIVGSQGDAGEHRRAAQSRGQRRAEGSQGCRAAGRPRRHPDRRHAGGLHQAGRGRDREVGEGDHGRQGHAGVSKTTVVEVG